MKVHNLIRINEPFERVLCEAFILIRALGDQYMSVTEYVTEFGWFHLGEFVVCSHKNVRNCTVVVFLSSSGFVMMPWSSIDVTFYHVGIDFL